MNTTTSFQNDIRPSTSTDVARRTRIGRRVATLVGSVVIGVLAGVGLFGSPASAATYYNQWVTFDVVANNTTRDLAIYFDGYGRPMAAWADLNANGTWDAYSAIQNGYPIGWLLNTVTEFDGQWDALISITGDRWSNSAGCVQSPTPSLIGGGYHSSGTQVRYTDTVYGLSWCYRPSRFTGVITAPIYENMFVTLTRLGGVAPALYCYSYPNAVGCYGRNW